MSPTSSTHAKRGLVQILNEKSPSVKEFFIVHAAFIKNAKSTAKRNLIAI